MKIIYLCYEASFLPVVVASIHLKLITEDKVPLKEELYLLPYYGKILFNQQGKIFYLGTDQKGNKVYMLGTRNGVDILQKAVKGFLEIFSYNSEEIVFGDLSKIRNILISIGLFFYCNLKIRAIGCFLITEGIKKSYFKLVNFSKDKQE